MAGFGWKLLWMLCCLCLALSAGEAPKFFELVYPPRRKTPWIVARSDVYVIAKVNTHRNCTQSEITSCEVSYKCGKLPKVKLDDCDWNNTQHQYVVNATIPADATKKDNCTSDSMEISITVNMSDHCDAVSKKVEVKLADESFAMFSIIACSLSALMCLVLFLGYASYPMLQKFPYTLVLSRSIMDFVFASIMLYLNVLEFSGGVDDARTKCNAFIAFLTQFSMCSSLLFWLSLSVSVITSIRNPFKRPEAQQTSFFVFTFVCSALTGTFCAVNSSYRADYHMCWFSKTKAFNTWNWVSFFIPMMFSVLLSLGIFLWVWRRWDLNSKRRELLHKRRGIIRKQRWFVLSFFLCMLGLGVLWSSASFLDDSGISLPEEVLHFLDDGELVHKEWQNELIQSQILQHKSIWVGFCLLALTTGLVDGLVWLAVLMPRFCKSRSRHSRGDSRSGRAGSPLFTSSADTEEARNSYPLEYLRQALMPSRGSSLSLSDDERYTNDEESWDGISEELRKEFIINITKGIQTTLFKGVVQDKPHAVDCMTSLKRCCCAANSWGKLDRLRGTKLNNCSFVEYDPVKFNIIRSDFFGKPFAKSDSGQRGPGETLQKYANMMFLASLTNNNQLLERASTATAAGKAARWKEVEQQCKGDLQGMGLRSEDLDRLKSEVSVASSGSYFYTTLDKRLRVKTITRTEKKKLLSILTNYHRHLKKNPGSRLCTILGLYSLKFEFGEEVFVVVMNDFDYTGNNEYRIDKAYDLKGSSIGRKSQVKRKDRNEKTRTIYKDLDLIDKIYIEKRHKILQMLSNDTEFLRQNNLMDYSLYLGVHVCTEKKVTTQTHCGLQVSSSGQAGSFSSGPRQHSLRQQLDRQGFQSAFVADVIKGHGIYHIGIIDILTEWNLRKKLEHYFKRYCCFSGFHCRDWRELSCVEPTMYQTRFIERLSEKFGINVDISVTLDGVPLITMNGEAKVPGSGLDAGAQQASQQKLNEA